MNENSLLTQEIVEYALLNRSSLDFNKLRIFARAMDIYEDLDAQDFSLCSNLPLLECEMLLLKGVSAIASKPPQREVFLDTIKYYITRKLGEKVLNTEFVNNIENSWPEGYVPPSSLYLANQCVYKIQQMDTEIKLKPVIDVGSLLNGIHELDKRASRHRLASIWPHNNTNLERKCLIASKLVKRSAFHQFINCANHISQYEQTNKPRLKSNSLVPLLQKHQQVNATNVLITHERQTKYLQTFLDQLKSTHAKFSVVNSAVPMLTSLDVCIHTNQLSLKSRKLKTHLYKLNSRKFMKMVFNTAKNVPQRMADPKKYPNPFTKSTLTHLISKIPPKEPSNGEILLSQFINCAVNTLSLESTCELVSKCTLPFAVIALHRMLNFKEVIYPEIRPLDPADLLRNRQFYLYDLQTKLDNCLVKVQQPQNRLAFTIFTTLINPNSMQVNE